MKRRKYTHNKEKALKNDVTVCSECGEELELFGISNSDIDLKVINERYKSCKEKGKFKGDLCARVFIASENEPIPLKDEDE